MTKNEIAKKIPSYVMDVMNRFFEAREDVYVVGGSLRDILLSKEPNDFDLATSALPQTTARIFSDKRLIETGIAHGTVTVINEGHPLEITTFRVDGSYTDRRHPDSVHFTRRIEEDLSRRDFTVNAIAFDPRVGLVDPFFGREDLENKILRAVGDPALRFEEDALRIMRAFRFSATLNFEIERETLMAARDKKEGLRMVARERIATELLKLLCAPDPRKALRSMVDAGVLQVVTDGYAPSEETVELMSKMPPMDIARLGAFLLSCDEARAREILDSLRLSSKQKTGAMAVFRGASERVCGAAEARRFSARYGAYAPYAIEAAYLSGMCDRTTLEAVRNNTSPCRTKDLDISGEDLLSMGIRGKAVGDALEMLLEAVLTDPSLNQKDRLLELIRNKKTREGQNERA